MRIATVSNKSVIKRGKKSRRRKRAERLARKAEKALTVTKRLAVNSTPTMFLTNDQVEMLVGALRAVSTHSELI